MRRSTSALAVVCLVLGTPATHAGGPCSPTWSDSEFDLQSWSTTPYIELGHGGSWAISQAGSGGVDGGAYMEITLSIEQGSPGNSSGVWVFIAHGEAIHDPATDGAIARIDYREHFRTEAGAQAMGPAFQQDGNIFWHGLTLADPTWTLVELTDLTADDFGNVDGFEPDFGDGGAPIQFGFIRANSTQGGGYTNTTGIDEWEVTVHTTGVSDLDGDGFTAVTDLLILLAAWGTCACCPADIDADGVVSVTDLLLLLAAWG